MEAIGETNLDGAYQTWMAQSVENQCPRVGDFLPFFQGHCSLKSYQQCQKTNSCAAIHRLTTAPTRWIFLEKVAGVGLVVRFVQGRERMEKMETQSPGGGTAWPWKPGWDTSLSQGKLQGWASCQAEPQSVTTRDMGFSVFPQSLSLPDLTAPT